MDFLLKIPLALLFGFISFISPCVLPLVPAYLSYISGVSLEEMQYPEKKKKALLKVLFNSLMFSLGFTLVFVALGATASAAGSFLLQYRHIIEIVLGHALVLFGLHNIGVIRIPFLLIEKCFEGKKGSLGLFGSLLIGLAFGFGWTPCVGPFLAGVLAMAASDATIYQGIILLVFYSAGLAIPFILSGLALNAFFGAFTVIRKYFRVIEIVGGVLLLLFGIVLIMGWLGLLSSYLGFLDLGLG